MSELTVHRYGRDGVHEPTLVLAHGLTEAGTAWPDAIGRWSGRYRILAVDQRGHGTSPRFTADQLGVSHQVWVADLLEVLGHLPEPPAVVGHSLGGLVALRAAAQAPDLVRAVVLEDPARPIGDAFPIAELVAHEEQFLDTFAGDGVAAEKSRMRLESAWSAVEIDAWADCKLQVDRGMIRHGLDLGASDWPQVYERLRMPTLVVVPLGGEMALRDGEVVNPRVSVARIPGVGHCVRRDDPDSFHAVVDPFLESAFG